jgi:hypothetical protein
MTMNRLICALTGAHSMAHPTRRSGDRRGWRRSVAPMWARLARLLTAGVTTL